MSFSVKITFMLIEAVAGAMALAFFVAFLVQLTGVRKKDLVRLTTKRKEDLIYTAIMCIFSIIEFVCLWRDSNVKMCWAVTAMYFMSFAPLLY